MANTVDILSRVRISEIYSALAGVKPKHDRSGECHGPAVWRGGDGLHVSMRDDRGVWHDFVTNEGGGVLDLVVRIRGGSNRDALKWVAQFAGIDLGDRKLPAEDLQKWKEEKARVERYLPVAQLWRRAMVALADETLTHLKSTLFDPSRPFAEPGEIYSIEQLLAHLQKIEGAELIAEFDWWKRTLPGITEALVREARRREQAEERALYRFIRAMGVGDGRESESRH